MTSISLRDYALAVAIAVGAVGMAAAQQPSPSLTPVEYRLGANDAVAIAVRQAPELNTTGRVAADGTIALPLIGDVPAAQKTVRELEQIIEDRLRAKFIREPDVTVSVSAVHSQGVSVVGAVQKPGVVQLYASATLLDVLSMAGGISADAGDEVVIHRTVEGQSTAPIHVSLSALLAADPAANVQLRAGDLVNVQAAGVIYVMGAVQKPGAYPIRGNGGVTVLRALAYGEGTTAVAAHRDAVVLRVRDGQRQEIGVDLDKVLKGRSPDLALQPQDVLFVPVSGGKAAARATLDVLARVLARGLIP